MTKIKFSLIGLLLFCSTFLLLAQVDQKYMAGAVPLVDGKVVFTREIKVSPEVSKGELLNLVQKWAEEELVEKKYEGSKARILLTSTDDGYIVVQGDEKLVFKSQLLMLDQTILTYQLLVTVVEGKCELEMKNIKYEYQEYKDVMPAEKMITDKITINKKGDKLNRHYDKFRKFTIDRVDELRNSLLAHLGKVSIEDIKAKAENTGTSIVDVQDILPIGAPSISLGAATATKGASMEGYTLMDVKDLSDNILAMFNDSWVLVATNDSKPVTAAWSGMGSFGGKSVAMTIVNKGTEEEIYTISFFTAIHKSKLEKAEKGDDSQLTTIITPSGAKAYAEAWMVIECKKVLEQATTESMIKDAQSKEWNSKIFEKLFMGEIINIWAR